MDFLVDTMLNLKAFNETLEAINENKTPISIHGLTDSAIGQIVYSLKENNRRDIVLVAEDNLRAKKIFEDIKNLGFDDINIFPKKDIFLYDRDSKSFENMVPRLNSLNKLSDGKCKILITTLDALRDKVSTKEIFKSATIKIQKDFDVDIKSVEKDLLTMGYERLPQVEGRGQFSIRGGIIDKIGRAHV